MWQEPGRTTLWALHLFPRQQLNKTRPCTSQFSALRIEGVSERERGREREIVSYLSEACFAQGYVSLFCPLVSSPPSITQQQEAKRKKKGKKRKKVRLSAHHAETLSSSPQRRVAVQAWKCSRLRRHECTQKGSLQQIRWRLIPASMWSINQQSRTNKL